MEDVKPLGKMRGVHFPFTLAAMVKPRTHHVLFWLFAL